jgi:hypothetical protein
MGAADRGVMGTGWRSCFAVIVNAGGKAIISRISVLQRMFLVGGDA